MPVGPAQRAGRPTAPRRRGRRAEPVATPTTPRGVLVGVRARPRPPAGDVGGVGHPDRRVGAQRRRRARCRPARPGPARVAAGPTTCAGFRQPKVTVTSAVTASPGTSPVSTATPLGTSTATTGGPLPVRRPRRLGERGRRAPRPPAAVRRWRRCPTMPSTTRSARSGRSRDGDSRRPGAARRGRRDAPGRAEQQGADLGAAARRARHRRRARRRRCHRCRPAAAPRRRRRRRTPASSSAQRRARPAAARCMSVPVAAASPSAPSPPRERPRRATPAACVSSPAVLVPEVLRDGYDIFRPRRPPSPRRSRRRATATGASG